MTDSRQNLKPGLQPIHFVTEKNVRDFISRLIEKNLIKVVDQKIVLKVPSLAEYFYVDRKGDTYFLEDILDENIEIKKTLKFSGFTKDHQLLERLSASDIRNLDIEQRSGVEFAYNFALEEALKNIIISETTLNIPLMYEEKALDVMDEKIDGQAFKRIIISPYFHKKYFDKKSTYHTLVTVDYYTMLDEFHKKEKAVRKNENMMSSYLVHADFLVLMISDKKGGTEMLDYSLFIKNSALASLLDVGFRVREERWKILTQEQGQKNSQMEIGLPSQENLITARKEFQHKLMYANSIVEEDVIHAELFSNFGVNLKNLNSEFLKKDIATLEQEIASQSTDEINRNEYKEALSIKNRHLNIANQSKKRKDLKNNEVKIKENLAKTTNNISRLEIRTGLRRILTPAIIGGTPGLALIIAAAVLLPILGGLTLGLGVLLFLAGAGMGAALGVLYYVYKSNSTDPKLSAYEKEYDQLNNKIELLKEMPKLEALANPLASEFSNPQRLLKIMERNERPLLMQHAKQISSIEHYIETYNLSDLTPIPPPPPLTVNDKKKDIKESKQEEDIKESKQGKVSQQGIFTHSDDEDIVNEDIVEKDEEKKPFLFSKYKF